CSFGGVVCPRTSTLFPYTTLFRSVVVNGGVMKTSGAQTYNDPMTLGANTTFTGAGINFANTVNGGFSLTANDSGTTTFGGAVGGGRKSTRLKSSHVETS